MSEPDTEPVLRVVRGDPSPEQLAALVTVVAAASTEDATGPERTSAWTDRSRLVRRPIHPRPGGWRASAWPG